MGEISAEAAAAVVAALALVATMVSVFYLAKQTSAVAEQTRVGAEQTATGNALAAIEANNTVLSALREVHVLILERPATRRYFYDNEPLPQHRDEHDRILTIAELLADVLSSGVHVHARVPGSTSAEPWEDYCRSTLASSPVLRRLVRAHPTWWPNLPPLLPPSEEFSATESEESRPPLLTSVDPGLARNTAPAGAGPVDRTPIPQPDGR